MVKMRSVVLVILFLFAIAIVFVPVLAESQVIIIYEPEWQGPAEVGKPTEFVRSGLMYALSTEDTAVEVMADVMVDAVDEPADATTTIKLDSHAKITKVVLDGIEYFNSVKDIIKFKKHSVRIMAVPVGTMPFFEIHYLMPAPKLTVNTIISNITNYLSRFTASTNYEQHTTNVVAPIAVPELPADWTFSAFSTEADGSKRQLRYYLKDSDGSGSLDEIGVVVPQLSTVDGELSGQLLLNPSKLLNYKFQQVRADNALLPFGWVVRQTVDFEIQDESPGGIGGDMAYGPGWLYGVWFYNPLSDEGYDDNSSFIVSTAAQVPIFGPPVYNVTSLDLNFKYKPSFTVDCRWVHGFEIMFSEEAAPYFGDTTHMFHLWGNGSITSDEFTVSSTPDINGWYDININKTLDYLPLGESRVVRQFFMPASGGCAGLYGRGEFWIDNVILTVDQ